MRLTIWFFVCAAVNAQEAKPQDPKPAPAEAKPADSKPTEAAPAEAAAAESPVPAEERWFTGWIDVGYRWRTGPGGNENVYRSIVDLGEGLKLLGADFTIIDPKRRLFDRIDARAANWGDDPYTTLHITARKERVYDFISSYRNLAYFNNLPSFANPLLERGIYTSQRTFDTRSRMSSFELNLLPSNWIIPYLAYDRASGYGSGVTTFVSDQNEYPVPDKTNFSQNNFRGGVRIEMPRYHATVEQGGTTFRDDQYLYQASGPNPGNRPNAYLGQNLYLTTLSQALGVRGDSIYTKALGTAQPKDWLALYGQFLYARPRNETNYQQFDTGNFVLPSQALFFNSQQYFLNSASKVPHQSWNAGAEVRLHPRVRVITSWMTDRIQISGMNSGQQTWTRAPTTRQFQVADSTALRNNFNQVETDVLWDITSQLILRGGYRYVWGDTFNLLLPPQGLTSQSQANLRRNIGKGGFNFRPSQKLSISGDIEGAGSENAYYRTSLFRYQRTRLQGSYQVSAHTSIAASFSSLNNRNPTPGIDYRYLGMQTSISVLWNPGPEKPVSFQGTYTRATIKSDINYLAGPFYDAEQSLYRDNAHSIQGLFDIRLPKKLGPEAKLSAGGSFFISSGSRPTNYFMPQGKLILPVRHGLAWVSEWTYYGYSESFYSYEGFRTHLITTGVRYTR